MLKFNREWPPCGLVGKVESVDGVFALYEDELAIRITIMLSRITELVWNQQIDFLLADCVSSIYMHEWSAIFDFFSSDIQPSEEEYLISRNL